MKKVLLISFLLVSILTNKVKIIQAQNFNIVSHHCFGGSSDDLLTGMIVRNPGEIYAVGSSFSSNGNLSVNHGLSDGWMIKTNQSYLVDWSESSGGANYDEINNMVVLAGGMVAAYGTGSTAGAINCTTSSDRDSYITVFNSSGTIVNEACIGGNQDDFGMDIIEDPFSPVGRGFVLTGHTRSSGTGAFSGLTNMGNLDIFVARTDSSFNIITVRLIQSSGFDLARFIRPLQNGNFLLVGETDGSNGDMSGIVPNGSDDIIVFELNGSDLSNVNKWRFGGVNAEHAYGLYMDATDFVITGSSWSPNFAGCSHNSLNGFMMKANYNGNMQWNTCIEGSGDDVVRKGIRSVSGNWFYGVGHSTSADLQFQSNAGGTDAFVAAVNYQTGNWNSTFSYGGTLNDEGYDIAELPSGY